MYNSLQKNCKAIMPLTILTLSIFIATALLFVTIYSLTQQHPQKTQITLQTIAESLHTTIQSIDSSTIEQHHSYELDTFHLPIHMTLTSNTIMITELKTPYQLRYVTDSHVSWWLTSDNSFWQDGETFHAYLKTFYGHEGTISDPLPNHNQIQEFLLNSFNMTKKETLLSPVSINLSFPLYIEKIMIYYHQPNNIDTITDTQSFTLIYQ